MSKKHLFRKGLSIVLSAAMLFTSLPADRAWAKEPEGEEDEVSEPDELCSLSFDDDDAETGEIDAGDAKAAAPAGFSLVKKTEGDAADEDDLALELNGTSQYIKLTDAYGDSLLAGKDEFVISMDYNNLDAAGAHWAFYAAPYEGKQEYPKENYLGMHLNGANINIERYYKGRNSATSSTFSCTAPSNNEWHHYDLVVREKTTILLKDGAIVGMKDSLSTITDMLGEEGIFQIGKANWGNGEFCKAQIDNFVIYDGIPSDISETVIASAKEKLAIAGADAVKDNIELPAYANGADITWASGNSEVIDDNGIIAELEEDTDTTLTATLSCGNFGKKATKDIPVKVLRYAPVSESLLAQYDFENSLKNATGGETDIAIPHKKQYESYDGYVSFEDGFSGNAVKTGEYGLRTGKKNLGDEFTVSLWAKSDGTLYTNEVLLMLGRGTKDDENWIAISGDDTAGYLKVWGNGGQLGHTNLFREKLTSNVWHNYVLVGTTGKITFYYDGVKIGEDTRSNNPLNGEIQEISLGVNPWGDQCFRGLIDEVKIYDAAARSKEIISAYNEAIVKNIADSYELDASAELHDDIVLPDKADNDVNITWKSSDMNVITDTGRITALSYDRETTLTATFTKGEAEAVKTFDVTVKGNDSVLCEMTFDGEDPLGNNSTVGGNKISKATYYKGGEEAEIDTVVRDGYGKALSLDGVAANAKYISVTGADGKSLLSGKDSFTISFDYNNHRDGTNWPFYVAPNANFQEYPKEYYIGACVSGGKFGIERYCNGRNSSGSSTLNTAFNNNEWHHYDIVVRDKGTYIFFDGKLAASRDSSTSIADILGENSIFQLGKANWSPGEYTQADIDNFVIYDGVKNSAAIQFIQNAKEEITISNPEMIDDDIILPTYINGADISWESSNEAIEVVEAEGKGKVTRGSENVEMTLTATISCGDFYAPEQKSFDVTVIKEGGTSIEDYLVGEYKFEDNLDNEVAAGDAAQPKQKFANNTYPDYTGTVKYEDGLSGKAVRVGDYGLKLNKNNIGKNFTVSMWVKPDGTYAQNQVMLYIGHHSPQKWVAASGSQSGTNKIKIWANGGVFGDNGHTTLYSPTINSGAWHNIVLVGTDGYVDAYYDGVKLSGNNRSNNPLDGVNQDIYIANNAWDALYSGLVDEVKVYRKNLNEQDILDAYNGYVAILNQNIVDETAEGYVLDVPEVLLSDITLPSKVNGVDVTWKSDTPGAITDAGVITRTDARQEATLTATFKKGEATKDKSFNVVIAASGKVEEVKAAKNAIRISTYIYKDIVLPSKGEYDTDITWQSSNTNILGNDGKIGAARPNTGEDNAEVTLTATVKSGEVSETREFDVRVMPKAYGYILGYIRGNNDRTGSLHLAYSKDGEEYTALNGNAGVLFAQINTNDGNKTLSTGIRFGGIGLFRNDDGLFGVVAPQGADSSSYYVYKSEDLLSFGPGKLLKSGDQDYDYYKNQYTSSALDASGIKLPEGATGTSSVMPVSKAEYEAIIKRFDVVKNTGIATDTLTNVTAKTEEDLPDVLPKTVKATYSDGSEAALNIKWDTDSMDMSKVGTYTLTGSVVPYDNPLIEQRADPHIKYDPDEEVYYFTASYPAYNNANNGYDRIILRKADSIQELGDAAGGKEKEITIWKAPSSGKMAKHVWAPEIHKIKGKWYVFFAAGNSDNIWAIRPYVLVCQNNDDPYDPDSWKNSSGEYEIHAATSKNNKYFNNMSLDMTYFEHNGKHYVIWADIIGQSALYMQEIDPKKPWEGISDKVICLTTPEFGWERDSERVNEGPTILKHDGKIFCAFSASGTGPEYCIGMLYADEDSDLMDASSWTKLGYPLLTSSDVPGEYGPGHNSFTVDADGNPVFVYHARSEECYKNECDWASSDPLYDPCRHARVKNVHWTEDGLPILKMSADEEIPEDKRKVSIEVTIQKDSAKDIEIAEITGYESSYVADGNKICPEIKVTYKGTELTKGTDYDVTYGANTEVGTKGSITVKAASDSGFKGSKTVYFDIVDAPILKVRYDMKYSDGKVKNMAGNSAYDATVNGLTEADFTTVGNTGIMKLNNNGYLSIPKGVIDDNTFTVSIVCETTKANDQWLWTFGRNSWAYAFFTPTNRDSKTKFTVAEHDVESGKTGAYSHEQTIQAASTAKNGSYHIYTVVVNNNVTALYVDGKKIGTGEKTYDITSLISGLDVIGYIGKSLYAADPMYVGSVGEFKVYDNALSDAQVAEESKSFDMDELIKADITATVLNGNKDFNNIKTNLSFPSKVGGKDITWTIPEDQTAIDKKGNVVRPVDGSDKTVQITASWDDGEVNRTFTFIVKAITIDSILEEVELPYSTEEGKEIYGNITLPTETNNGIKITWKSDSNIIDVASHENEDYDDTPAGTVTRPQTDTVVKLTAEITVNGSKGTRDYNVKVKAAPKKLNDEDFTDYFFTYFTGEGKSNGEQIYFASSEDGLNWTDLNNGQPSLTSTLGEKGVRDPFIIRSYEGDKFYIIATDLKINGGNGWAAAQSSGSQSLMVWESTDLVNWSNQRMVEVSAVIDAGCTWAPEATYDPKTGEYIVYWASKVDDDGYTKQRLYYSKTRDFYSFTDPEIYIENDQSSIDTTMIEHNGTYYRYTKNEGDIPNEFGVNNKTVFIEKSDGVLGKFTHIPSDSLNKENRGVEGPAIFKLNKDDAEVDTWCLLVDNYGAGGYYPLLTTDLDSGVFTRPAAGTYKMPTGARHGTPIRITREEYCRIMGIEYDPNATTAPAATNTPAPTTAPASGVDLSGTKVLYEEGTVTYNEATGSVTGTNVKGLLIPLGITIPRGAPVDITVSGTASTGMRGWLSDGAEQRMSDIASPINFDEKFTLVAEPYENGDTADHLQIKGPSYDSSFSSITITKVVVEYDPAKAPTASPEPTAKPTKAPTAEPSNTTAPQTTEVPTATAAPGTVTPGSVTPGSVTPGSVTPGTTNPGTVTPTGQNASDSGNKANTANTPKIKLSCKTKKIKVGDKLRITAKLINVKGKVKWSVNKKKIASISKKGTLRGKKKGKVKVTAKVKKVKASITIRIMKK